MRRAVPARGWSALGAVLAGAALAVLLTGCETLSPTTLDENQGAYQDAREFLSIGRTTREEVLAKYGKPGTVTPLEKGGERWEYRKREAVLVDAYSNTPLSDDGAMMRGGLGGYQHTVQRTTRLELFFDTNGILAHYRIERGVQ